MEVITLVMWRLPYRKQNLYYEIYKFIQWSGVRMKSLLFGPCSLFRAYKFSCCAEILAILHDISLVCFLLFKVQSVGS